MDIFLKASAVVLISIVLGLILSKQNKDISLLLTITVCCAVAMAAISYLHPIIDFFRTLKGIGKLDSQLFGILLKAVGIGLLSEIAVLICSDFGNNALGKTLQMLSTVVILWISLPLFNNLIELIQRILEAV